MIVYYHTDHENDSKNHKDMTSKITRNDCVIPHRHMATKIKDMTGKSREMIVYYRTDT